MIMIIKARYLLPNEFVILQSPTMNPGLKNVSICSQQENCQISLKIVSIRSQISS